MSVVQINPKYFKRYENASAFGSSYRAGTNGNNLSTSSSGATIAEYGIDRAVDGFILPLIANGWTLYKMSDGQTIMSGDDVVPGNKSTVRIRSDYYGKSDSSSALSSANNGKGASQNAVWWCLSKSDDDGDTVHLCVVANRGHYFDWTKFGQKQDFNNNTYCGNPRNTSGATTVIGDCFCADVSINIGLSFTEFTGGEIPIYTSAKMQPTKTDVIYSSKDWCGILPTSISGAIWSGYISLSVPASYNTTQSNPPSYSTRFIDFCGFDGCEWTLVLRATTIANQYAIERIVHLSKMSPKTFILQIPNERIFNNMIPRAACLIKNTALGSNPDTTSVGYAWNRLTSLAKDVDPLVCFSSNLYIIGSKSECVRQYDWLHDNAGQGINVGITQMSDGEYRFFIPTRPSVDHLIGTEKNTEVITSPLRFAVKCWVTPHCKNGNFFDVEIINDEENYPLIQFKQCNDKILLSLNNSLSQSQIIDYNKRRVIRIGAESIIMRYPDALDWVTNGGNSPVEWFSEELISGGGE